jgi:hypothetical protein
VNTEHPITPPPELVEKWFDDARNAWAEPQHYIAAQAAQWGADQELEACCAELPGLDDYLRAARRPEPPSLKEQALGALGRFNTNAHTRAEEMAQDFDLIRRALEDLDD